jgi:hypothetical protein
MRYQQRRCQHARQASELLTITTMRRILEIFGQRVHHKGGRQLSRDFLLENLAALEQQHHLLDVYAIF